MADRYIDTEKIKYHKLSVCEGHGLNFEYTVAYKHEVDAMPTEDVVPKSEAAREVLAEIDNRLHDMAMEYANAGHKEYFAVCEMVYHKVLRAVEKKYTEGENV